MIEVEALSVVYPTASPALKEISFKLKIGEAVGVLGKSGAGKTTLLRALLRVLPAGTKISGKILWQDKNLLEISQKQFYVLRGKLFGFLPQNAQAALNPFLKIRNSISESILAHKKISKPDALLETKNLFELVGIEPSWLQAYPNQLSGGMKTRCALASVLGLGASYILLDEPTTGLDVITQDHLVKILKKIKEQENRAILILSHNLPFLFQVCDKILLLEQGKLVEKINISQPQFKTQLARQFLDALIERSAL